VRISLLSLAFCVSAVASVSRSDAVDVTAAFRLLVDDLDSRSGPVRLPPLSEADYDRFNSHSYFAQYVSKLARGQVLSDSEVLRAVHMLVRVVTPTTARRFSSTTTYVLDGPVPGARGQAGVELLFAFEGSRVLCAKVGSATLLSHELAVSQAVHSVSVAPTVMQAVALVPVFRRRETEQYAALLMPLFPMTVGVASLAMDTGVASAREAFLLNVSLCTLSGVKAFSAAGYAHGDIKPSNLLVSSDGSGKIVLGDFGTARKFGETFIESSEFSLNLERVSSLHYDVVSTGATLASLLSGSINVAACVDIAGLVAAMARLPASELTAPLWKLIDACLAFPVDGAAAELDQLLHLLSDITGAARLRLGSLAHTLLTLDEAWPKLRL
jgi:hypothetical protein